jgi:hypothetical protein
MTDDRKTINLDLPHDYFKREHLRVLGIARVAENEKVVSIALSRKPEDDELRRIHEHLKAFWQ